VTFVADAIGSLPYHAPSKGNPWSKYYFPRESELITSDGGFSLFLNWFNAQQSTPGIMKHSVPNLGRNLKTMLTPLSWSKLQSDNLWTQADTVLSWEFQSPLLRCTLFSIHNWWSRTEVFAIAWYLLWLTVSWNCIMTSEVRQVGEGSL
jgi:hypothetical protein